MTGNRNIFLTTAITACRFGLSARIDLICSLLDFALKRQHCNIVFLRGFADVSKKGGTNSFQEFKGA
jgi:hypothetical protein